MAWRRALGCFTTGWLVACAGCGDGGAANGDAAIGDAAVAQDAAAGGQADAGEAGKSEVVWGVLVHLTDAPPADIDALAGLHLEVTDLMQPPGPLATTLDWASSPDGFAYARILHGCTADKTPDEILIETCAMSDSPGCLDLLFGSPGPSGTFTHPNGDVCQIQGGDAELFVRALPPSGPLPTDFTATDTATGTFRVRCDGAGGVTLWLNGTFALRATRTYLLC